MDANKPQSCPGKEPWSPHWPQVPEKARDTSLYEKTDPPRSSCLGSENGLEGGQTWHRGPGAGGPSFTSPHPTLNLHFISQGLFFLALGCNLQKTESRGAQILHSEASPAKCRKRGCSGSRGKLFWKVLVGKIPARVPLPEVICSVRKTMFPLLLTPEHSGVWGIEWAPSVHEHYKFKCMA